MSDADIKTDTKPAAPAVAPKKDPAPKIQAATEAPNDAIKALRAQRFVTVEQWAEAYGYTPQYATPPSPADKPKKVMRRVYNPRFEHFAAARAFHNWPVGKELSEGDFLTAVADATDPARGKNIFR